MLKIFTIVGERPAYIRLIPTIKKLDTYFNHKLLWISQNFEYCLSTQFFKEFNRYPDIEIKNKEKKVGLDYMGFVIPKLKKILEIEKPDIVLVLGDTNASFCAVLVAKKLGIIVVHCEAGNRCYRPDITPEEINRYIIDSVADWHLCYTQRSREQLLLEGKRPDRVIVVGNPIFETILHNYKITAKDKSKNYALVTIHRKENIDNPKRLKQVFSQLQKLKYKVIISNHPSLKNKINNWKFKKNLKFINPTNFTDWLFLEKNAKVVVSDSGTLPEECHILDVPCVLLRYSTERPELLESNDMVVCPNPLQLSKAIEIAVGEHKYGNELIPEYHGRVSSNIVKLLMRCNNGNS